MRILDVNARAIEEYQFTREELLRLSFADLGLDRDREKTKYVLKSLFPTEVTLLPVLHHTRLDGSVFMVSLQARLTRFRDRPAIIAAVWDVTERLEKHAMLIQASKMATLGEMATGIAHELNQPLNVIRLGCDYLVKRIKAGKELSDADLKEVHGELAASVERAARIIKHLREFGRKPEDTMFPIDVNEPIRNVFTLLGTQLTNKGIRWELDLQEEIPHILGDTNGWNRSSSISFSMPGTLCLLLKPARTSDTLNCPAWDRIRTRPMAWRSWIHISPKSEPRAKK